MTEHVLDAVPRDFIVNKHTLGLFCQKNKWTFLSLGLDAMNLSAELHSEMMRIGFENPLAEGGSCILDTSIGVSKSSCDAFVALRGNGHEESPKSAA